VIRSLLLALVVCAAAVGSAGAAPDGQISIAVHVTLAPRWLDPAENESAITPFMVLYALHDAMLKPMPGGVSTPSLAESWSVSKDGTTYDFVLRSGVKFHNGEAVTADDVKFSFDRYHGGAAKLLKDKVREVRVVDARHVRFVLKEPWPDFLTFYGTTSTGAGWVVPKKYVEKVGDDGFKKAPIGAGPYKLVSVNPGIEMTLEAFDGYWRKVPAVKRIVLKSVTDETTRAAALKRGEVDIAFFLNGPIAEDVRRTPGLKLTAVRTNTIFFLDFVDQWDPKSPWHDGAFARRRASPSTARRSTKPRPSASPGSRATSSRGTWSSRCRSPRIRTTSAGPSSSWRTPGTRAASTAATSRRTRPTSEWRKRS
jgi:peptide/nickel transport system substrate-binding protein